MSGVSVRKIHSNNKVFKKFQKSPLNVRFYSEMILYENKNTTQLLQTGGGQLFKNKNNDGIGTLK